MSLFGSKKTDVVAGTLGVDIGDSGVKIVEVVPESGRLRLVTYGYSEPNADNVLKPVVVDPPTAAAGIIRQIIASSGMKATHAAAALPCASVFHAIITVPIPKSSKDDLRPVIEAQARKILPLPLEEMILDSHVLDKELLPTVPAKEPSTALAPTARHIRVQITGAPKSLVAKYVELFKAAKLDLVSLETEAFALLRSLVGKDASRVMVVDIGSERTNIIIAEKGVPFLARVVKTGGGSVTSALASSLGVGVAEAETMKKDMTFQEAGSMPPVIEVAIKPLIHELRYALELYADQDFHENRTVDKIILTGGSSLIPGLVKAVTAALNVNCYLGDPWARIATQPEARAVFDEVGTKFAVAAGLAMRAKDEK